MNIITRRQFLQGAGVGVLALAGVNLPVCGGTKPKTGGMFCRIRPILGENLRPKELAFCRRAKFAMPADAMRAVASRKMTVELYVEYLLAILPSYRRAELMLQPKELR